MSDGHWSEDEMRAGIFRSRIHSGTWSPVIEDTDQASTFDNAGPLRLVKAQMRQDLGLDGKRFRWRPDGDNILILEIWEKS